MAFFSSRSLGRLETCDDRLRILFEEVVTTYDCTILCGFRSEEDQNLAVSDGRSKTEWPNSKHNSSPSKAVDVAPYPIDWSDTNRFYHFGGFVQSRAESLGFRVRWGGDWDSDRDLGDQTFMDLVHFELME